MVGWRKSRMHTENGGKFLRWAIWCTKEFGG